MKYDPNIHHRRSIRLANYDYSSPGAYFITLCTCRHEQVFGEIVAGRMLQNHAGFMVERWWLEIEKKFLSAKIDSYVVMPNHFHGAVVIEDSEASANSDVGADLRVCPRKGGGHIRPSLPSVVQWFKTMTTNEYIRDAKEQGRILFQGKLWQRDYFEHVIRNEEALNEIRQYIGRNPSMWDEDPDNPSPAK
jgi:putative transposase